MAWEYLKTNPWDDRYRLVASVLPDLTDKIVVDLDCGEGNFRHFINYKRYYSNDINPVDNEEGMEFHMIPDTDVDIKSDVLCLFGYAAGEFTGTKEESIEAANSLVRLSKYKPQFIVIEAVQKFEDEYKCLSKLVDRLPNYEVINDTIINIDASHLNDIIASYVGKRHIVVLKLK